MRDYLTSIRDIGFDPSEFEERFVSIDNSTKVRLRHRPTGTIVFVSGKSHLKTRDKCLREMETKLKELLK